MICVNVIAADSLHKADRLAATQKQKFLNLAIGVRVKLPKPARDMNTVWNPLEVQRIMTQLRGSMGNKMTGKQFLEWSLDSGNTGKQYLTT